MEPKVYVEERLEGQRKWYSRKSMINKRYYNWFNILTIVFSILIPLIVGFKEFFSSDNTIMLTIGVLGTLVAILTSISGLMKFKEKWINYRLASERLKREKFLWETKTTPYDKADAYAELVKRIETIINIENTDWVDYISEERSSKNG